LGKSDRQRIMTADRLGLELEGQNALLNDGIIFLKKVEVNEFSEVSLRSAWGIVLTPRLAILLNLLAT